MNLLRPSAIVFVALACASGSPRAANVFTNVALPGSVFESPGGGRGLVLFDYDNDVDLDVLIASSNLRYEPGDDKVPPVILLRNDGGGSYVDVTREVGIVDDWRFATFGVTVADVNNDGWIDFYAATGGKQTGSPRDFLYVNHAGTFVDETAARGLPAGPNQSFVGVWIDADRDGWIDLLTVGYERTPTRFFRNVGGELFVERTAAVGLEGVHIFGQGASTGDVNQDGWTDVYIPTIRLNRNLLLMNDAGRGFVDAAPRAGVANLPANAYASSLVDLDHDGYLDLVVSAFSDITVSTKPEVSRIFKNVPAPELGPTGRKFRDISADVEFAHGVGELGPIGGGAMGLQTGDFDLDGYPDVYVGNGGPKLANAEKDLLFWNEPTGDGSFVLRNVTHVLTNPATGDTSTEHMTHGALFFDYDDDGDVDIYANSGGPGYWGSEPRVAGQANALWRNEAGHVNHFVRVLVQGAGAGATNAAGIGVVVRVHVPSAAPELAILQEVRGAGGFAQQNSLWQTFGLGPHLDCTVEVRWTTGETDLYENVPADSTVVVTEGGTAEIVATFEH